jgi:hypothetical protein
MTKEEGNLLISGFMGSPVLWDYSESWDLLIPCVKKIYEIGKDHQHKIAEDLYEKAGGMVTWTNEYGNKMWNVHVAYGKFDLVKTFLAAADFIQYATTEQQK